MEELPNPELCRAVKSNTPMSARECCSRLRPAMSLATSSSSPGCMKGSPLG